MEKQTTSQLKVWGKSDIEMAFLSIKAWESMNLATKNVTLEKIAYNKNIFQCFKWEHRKWQHNFKLKFRGISYFRLNINQSFFKCQVKFDQQKVLYSHMTSLFLFNSSIREIWLKFWIIFQVFDRQEMNTVSNM